MVPRPNMKGHFELAASGKKMLHRQEEFEIMKLVLDKFLWLGILIIGYGLYRFYESLDEGLAKNIAILASGAIILILFVVLLRKEYEIVDK